MCYRHASVLFHGGLSARPCILPITSGIFFFICILFPFFSSFLPFFFHACFVVCVCGFIPFILDIRLVDVPAGITHEEGHTGFLHLPSAVLALIFLARRILPFLSLVDREVKFCVLQINRSPLVGHLFYLFICFVRRSPSSCDCIEIRIHVSTSEGFEVTNWTTGAIGAFFVDLPPIFSCPADHVPYCQPCTVVDPIKCPVVAPENDIKSRWHKI